MMVCRAVRIPEAFRPVAGGTGTDPDDGKEERGSAA